LKRPGSSHHLKEPSDRAGRTSIDSLTAAGVMAKHLSRRRSGAGSVGGGRGADGPVPIGIGVPQRRGSLTIADIESSLRPAGSLGPSAAAQRVSARSVGSEGGGGGGGLLMGAMARRYSMSREAVDRRRRRSSWADIATVARSVVAAVEATPRVPLLAQWQAHGDPIRSLQVGYYVRPF
jgi:hypothetical protein